ncbi:MAG: hypothetical protein KDB14_27060, partial [Planctomycetales bacterium]|nr:hypothetical protein [Planctomycetales bacterium]
IGDAQAAVPVDDRFHHPLATLYRANVLSALRQLDARDELRPRLLFDMVETVRVPVETLRDVDPNLDTLANLNTPADYFAALSRAGYRCADSIRAQLLQ